MIQVPTTLKRVRRIVRIERTGTDVTLGQDPVLLAFCYSVEQLNLLMLTMVTEGKKAPGSMGNHASWRLQVRF